MNELVIDREYVTLGQVLKMTDTISSGGMAKWFLSENEVFVNGRTFYSRNGKGCRSLFNSICYWLRYCTYAGILMGVAEEKC